MNADIHWLSDALITLGLLGAFIVTFVVVSCCRLSGLISREEEADELRASFDRLDRAA